MAAVPLRPTSTALPSPNSGRIRGVRGEVGPTTLPLLNTASAGSPSFSCSAQWCAVASGSVKSSIHGRLPRSLRGPFGKRRFPRTVPFVSHSKDSDGNDDLEKAWEQVLQSFKQQAMKMQSVSQEAYELYSKKARAVLEEASKNMRVQADKASHDIALIAQEINEEGREYISAASENYPEPVKDVVELYSAPPTQLNDLSKVHDFYLGIPYGAILALGGFTFFMFTGSIAAIRFGVILGGFLLALSVSSLRAWKKGKTSALLLKGQAVVAAIIFGRELRFLLQKSSVPAFLMTAFSGAMLGFYVYRSVLFRQNRRPNLEE